MNNNIRSSIPFLPELNSVQSPPKLKRKNTPFHFNKKDSPTQMVQTIQWNVPDHIQAPIALKPSRGLDFYEKQNSMIQAINNYS
jgi:hypothetical protein